MEPPSRRHVETTAVVPKIPTERAKQLIALYHDYHTAFDSDAGQRVLKHLRGNAHQDGETLNLKNPNALTFAFCEGKRQMYLVIERMLKLDVQQIEKGMAPSHEPTGGANDG